MREGFVTDGALMWFVARVNKAVLPQVARGVEPFAAARHRALKRPRIGVDPHVDIQPIKIVIDHHIRRIFS